ncbi:NAD-dependent epimerase/dehydratase family protein [Salipiger sp. 1_MG-2023]|uniref:NAD-dependent epimerase/dehydratase family protein n=1 Tax=Salipiger sp. 1_MG-2023 TaxID=3062665 RepID=UPI0026E45E51|nr:NAD-dependent epimerase/dehydratase family protein [Salipiger sp. 1_MG-2023]MDO6584045.1 NAD-dependent epimerase/dehydratase family protein [Salipiger sp. 1_MG-2023]
MTIYVTGSSGVLGFEILSHLHGAGFDAMGVARRPLPRSGRGLRQISTPEVLTAGWMPRPRGETIVHCAGLPSPRVHFNDFAELSRREIEPQLRFAEKLLAKGWRGHMVYLSSAGVYGDTDQLPIPEDAPLAAKSWYALQKMAVEQGLSFLAQRYGFRLTILRVANVYGAETAGPSFGVVTILLDALRSGKPFRLFGGGTSLRDYIHVSDFCALVERCCTVQVPGPVTVLNVGTGVGTSLADLAELLPRVAGGSLDLQHEPQAGEVGSSVLDITRARALLQWAPRVALEDGLRHMVGA